MADKIELDEGVLGTPRAREIEQRDAQQGFMANATDAFYSSTAAGAAKTLLEDEVAPLKAELFPERAPSEAPAWVQGNEQAEGMFQAAEAAQEAYDDNSNTLLAGMAALIGMRAGEADYDVEEKYDELTQGIPFQFHQDIVGNENYAAALRARDRITTDLERGQRMGMQQGLSATTALFAGSMVDVDLPLTFMTGGGYQAARVARAGVLFSQKAGLSTAAGLRVSTGLVGANAGLQAGILSGAGQVAWRETADWTLIAESALAGAAMGGGLNAAVKGDLGLVVKQARDELHTNMARNTPEFNRDTDVSKLRGSYVEVQEVADTSATAEAGGTVNAARTPGVLGDEVWDKLEGIAAPREQAVTSATSAWKTSSGWIDQRAAEKDEWLYKFAVEGWGSKLTNDYSSLLKSESPTMNFMAGEIFESPHGFGRGRATSAILSEQYEKQMVTPVVEAESYMMRWAKLNDGSFIPKANVGGRQVGGAGIKESAQREFGRQMFLEVNARNLGINRAPRNQNEVLVHAAVDKIAGTGQAGADLASRARQIGRGRDGEIGIDGFDALEDMAYMRQTWNNLKIRDVIRKGVVKENDLVSALAQGYRKAGWMGPGQEAIDLATTLAKALITRAKSTADGVNMNLNDLTNADGRAFLEAMLRDANVPMEKIESIIERITGNKEESGKMSSLKRRNSIDLSEMLPTTDGSNMQIVDLLDTDAFGGARRYARQVAGASALARKGIRSRTERETFINAAMKEREALGEEPLDPEVLRAMFTNFDGGPIHGYAFGQKSEGVGPAVAFAKRLTSVSLLQGLGFAQMAETGPVMAAVGLGNFVDRAIHQRLSKLGREEQRKTLRSLEFLTGRLGEDHRYFAPHLEMDSMGRHEMGEFMAGMQGMLGKAQYLNGYTSGFNQIRSWQQTTLALGKVDSIIQAGLREVDGKRVGWNEAELKRLKDFGIDQRDAQKIIKLVDDGVITLRDNLFGGKAVDSLNMDKWDFGLAEDFSAGITRTINQSVQKSMAGESDVFMNQAAVSLFTQFKTFPLQAISKQSIRHMRHLDQEALMTVLYGASTAYMALYLRDVAYGRERDVKTRALAAVGYSNMTSFVPMVNDPMVTLMGLHDYRFNQYGPHAEILNAPFADVGNKLLRVPGATNSMFYDPIAGGFDKGEQSAVKTLPFMNLPVLSRLMYD